MKILSRIVSSPTLWVLALALAIGSVIAFGIIGIERADFGQFDMRPLYAAGRCLTLGLNPYNPAFLRSCSLNWPDLEVSAYASSLQSAPLAIGLSYLPYYWAESAMIFLNLISALTLAVLCALPAKFNAGLGVAGRAPEARWLIPALVLGNPFTAHVVWMGQTTLIATACLTAGWIFAHRDRPWSGGCLIAIGAIKPQIAILVILWLFLERRWKLLATACGFGSLFILPTIFVIGPISAFTEWLAAISRYQSSPFNSLGFIHLFGLQNFLYSIGVSLPSLVPLGLAATILLWWFRDQFVAGDILPIIMGLTLIFSFSHDYDIVALIPLIPAFWRHLRGRVAAACFATVLMIALFLPQRLLRSPHIPEFVLNHLNESILTQYRVLVVIALAFWLIVLSHREGVTLPSSREPQSADVR